MYSTLSLNQCQHIHGPLVSGWSVTTRYPNVRVILLLLRLAVNRRDFMSLLLHQCLRNWISGDWTEYFSSVGVECRREQCVGSFTQSIWKFSKRLMANLMQFTVTLFISSLPKLYESYVNECNFMEEKAFHLLLRFYNHLLTLCRQPPYSVVRLSPRNIHKYQTTLKISYVNNITSSYSSGTIEDHKSFRYLRTVGYTAG